LPTKLNQNVSAPLSRPRVPAFVVRSTTRVLSCLIDQDSAMAQPTDMRRCEVCGKEVNRRGLASHERACRRRAVVQEDATRLAHTTRAQVHQAAMSQPASAMGNIAPRPLGAPRRPGRSSGSASMPPAASASQARAEGPSAGFDPDVLLPPSPPPPPPLPSPPPYEVDDFKTEYHPKAHREPVIKHFDEFTRAPPPIDFSKLNHEPWLPEFKTRLDFELAEFTLGADLNAGQIATLMALIQRIVADPSQLSFTSSQDIMKAWSAASHKQPAFEETKISVPYGDDARTYSFWHRSIWDWGLKLARDPTLAPLFSWHAVKFHKWDGRQWVRFVDEPNTGDLWWEMETQIPEGGHVLAFIIYADKTRLSSFGSQKGYPIIARLANLPAEVRNGNGYGGGQVVGLLPIVEDEKEEGKPGFVNLKRVVWHEAFWILLAAVAKWAQLGHTFKCGDDVVRVLYPIILLLVSDYEEQSMMALIRGVRGAAPCPVCLVPQDQQVHLNRISLHPQRTKEDAHSVVGQVYATRVQQESHLKPQGLRPIENVFWRIPYCDPYRALSWDRLHAYHIGLFSDHLFDEFQKVVKLLGRNIKVQIDAQFDQIPSWRELNHFSQVCEVNFTDGTKYEDMSQPNDCATKQTKGEAH
ncbi:hypothetical protein LXA43DRAFT_1145587, partial [Ganoderma leucocontextum]